MTTKFVQTSQSIPLGHQASAPALRQDPAVRRKSAEQIQERFGYLPTQTTVLGLCDDQLPVLFDLSDDRPGPLLVCGDTACGKTELLQGMLRTTITLNSPYDAKYAVIASNPEEWSEFNSLGRDKHCLGLHGFYEDGAGAMILRMAEVAEQRRTGRQLGPAILLVIDDLSWLAKADSEIKLNFEWLLKVGPSLLVWPVVSLPTQSAVEMARMTTYFRTRLIGHMQTDPANRRLTLFEGLDTQKLDQGKQFAVRVENEWLKFRLPVYR